MDLFGETTQVVQSPKAYAGMPGAGPDDKSCRHCKHYCRVRHNTKVHLKCGLQQEIWTHGPGTDIKAATPACDKFLADD